MHLNKTTEEEKRIDLTAEELYDHVKSNKITQRQKRFIVRALRDTGYKVSVRQKKWLQRMRGKDPFKPTDLPKVFSNINNLNCMMGSLLSAVTGTRREETAEILKENIDFAECRIRLIVTKKGVPQDVYFPRSISPLLQKWIHYTGNSKYLLPKHDDPGKPIALATLNDELNKATQKAGLREELYVRDNGYRVTKYGFHSFRKFFCSMLVNSGVPIETTRKLMRHERIELTARVYAQLGKRSLTQAMEQIDPYAERKENPLVETQAGISVQTGQQNPFVTQYIRIFNDYRDGRITEEEYQRQKQELSQIQTLSKA